MADQKVPPRESRKVWICRQGGRDDGNGMVLLVMMITMMIVIAMVIMTGIEVASTLSFGIVVLVSGNGFRRSWIR